MGENNQSDIPSRLNRAIENGNLVVFCGAGVSMASPADVPSWGQFNEILLSELKSKSRSALDLPDDLSEALDHLSIDDVGYRDFSDALVRSFAGESYFSVVSVLDGTEPNANHLALVELARQGALKAIITTNFDTLIETAFQRVGEPLDVVTEASDLQRDDHGEDACVLYKIHGSADEESTLVDTASQKIQGLPEAIRSQLQALYRDNHVFVIGYSGSDLLLGLHYCGFDVIDGSTPGISWLFRPNSDPSEDVETVLERASNTGQIVRGNLPNILTELVGEVPQPTTSNGSEGDQDPESRIRAQIHELLDEPHIDPLVCASFCTRLFRKIGDQTTARKFDQRITQHEAMQKKGVRLRHLPVIRMIASTRIRDGQFEEAETWIAREISVTKQALDDLPKDADRKAAQQLQHGLAGAYLNKAGIEREQGNLDRGQKFLQIARRWAIRSDRLDIRAQVEFQKGLFGVERGLEDESLACFRTARRLAKHGGHAQTLLESIAEEIEILLKFGEYAVAEERLESAQRYSYIYDYLEYRIKIGMLEAELQARQGKLTDARQRLRELAEEASNHNADRLANLARVQIIRTGFENSGGRDEVLDTIDQIQSKEKIKDQELQTVDLNRFSLLTEEEIKSLRSKAKSAEAFKPYFFTPKYEEFEGEPEHSASLRRALIENQFLGEYRAVAKGFQILCKTLTVTPRPQRLNDIALCYREAGQRVGDSHIISESWLYTGMAFHQKGRVEIAINAYERAKEINEGSDRTLQARIDWRIAAAASKKIPPEHRPKLFSESVSILADNGQPAEEFLARAEYAKSLWRNGEIENALEQAEHALENSDAVPNSESSDIESFVESLKRKIDREPVDHTIDDALTPLGLSPNEVTSDDFESIDTTSLTTEQIAEHGRIAIEAGYHEQGRELVLTALDQYKEDDNLKGISRCLNNIAGLHAQNGEWERAITLAERALEIRRHLQSRRGEVLTLSNLAFFYYQLGYYEKALGLCEKVEQLPTSRGGQHAKTTAHYIKGCTLTELNRNQEALKALNKFIEGAESSDDPELRNLAQDIHDIFDSNHEVNGSG